MDQLAQKDVDIFKCLRVRMRMAPAFTTAPLASYIVWPLV